MIPKFRFWYEREDYYPDENYMCDVYKIEYIADNGIELNDVYIFNPYTNVAENIYANTKIYLMQSTGLEDKNGVEIYEGDVVSANDGLFEGEIQRIGACFFARFIDTCNNYFFQPADWLNEFQNVIEVIGNIYEHPELLEAPND